MASGKLNLRESTANDEAKRSVNKFCFSGATIKSCFPMTSPSLVANVQLAERTTRENDKDNGGEERSVASGPTAPNLSFTAWLSPLRPLVFLIDTMPHLAFRPFTPALQLDYGPCGYNGLWSLLAASH